MKTKVNQMMVLTFLALILFAGNLSADGKVANVVSGLENIEEIKLEVKEWMVDESFWMMAGNDKLSEENLVFEYWMLDEAKWNIHAAIIPVETEKDLSVETWMIDKLYWN